MTVIALVTSAGLRNEDITRTNSKGAFLGSGIRQEHRASTQIQHTLIEVSQTNNLYAAFRERRRSLNNLRKGSSGRSEAGERMYYMQSRSLNACWLRHFANKPGPRIRVPSPPRRCAALSIAAKHRRRTARTGAPRSKIGLSRSQLYSLLVVCEETRCHRPSLINSRSPPRFRRGGRLGPYPSLRGLLLYSRPPRSKGLVASMLR
jgi:hypothetical protein